MTTDTPLTARTCDIIMRLVQEQTMIHLAWMTRPQRESFYGTLSRLLLEKVHRQGARHPMPELTVDCKEYFECIERGKYPSSYEEYFDSIASMTDTINEDLTRAMILHPWSRLFVSELSSIVHDTTGYDDGCPRNKTTTTNNKPSGAALPSSTDDTDDWSIA